MELRLQGYNRCPRYFWPPLFISTRKAVALHSGMPGFKSKLYLSFEAINMFLNVLEINSILATNSTVLNSLIFERFKISFKNVLDCLTDMENNVTCYSWIYPLLLANSQPKKSLPY